MTQITGKCTITYSRQEDEIVIDMIEVDSNNRRKGFARKAMLAFMKKNYGKIISLHAFGQDSSTYTNKLVEFYKSFGFDVVAGNNIFGFEMQNNPY